jgi:hypothetical protein
MPSPKLNKLFNQQMSRKEFLSFTALAFVSIFGVVGVITELLSHAETASTAGEAEKGTPGGTTTILTDTAASGGQAISFGTPTAPLKSAKVYMGGYNDSSTEAVAVQWAEAQGVPAAGGFFSVYQWGNGWAQVQETQVGYAPILGSYPGPRCLNAALTQSQSETDLSSALSGNSLTSAALACHTASATACAQNGVQFIRWAWEFNGGSGYNWMPPFSSYTAAEFVTLWRLTYNAWNAAAVAAGKPNNWFKFIFCMNPADYSGVTNLNNYYPGMPYAAYLTVDEYDRSGGNLTGWNEALNDPNGFLNSFVTLALSAGAEGVGFPEWGIRTDAYAPTVIPDPSYINSGFAWAKATAAQGLNVLMWPWGAGFTGSISTVTGGTQSWNFASWPTMWSALTSNVATGISEGWIATTNPTT